jgi:hypothetical protein
MNLNFVLDFIDGIKAENIYLESPNNVNIFDNSKFKNLISDKYFLSCKNIHRDNIILFHSNKNNDMKVSFVLDITDMSILALLLLENEYMFITNNKYLKSNSTSLTTFNKNRYSDIYSYNSKYVWYIGHHILMFHKNSRWYVISKDDIREVNDVFTQYDQFKEYYCLFRHFLIKHFKSVNIFLYSLNKKYHYSFTITKNDINQIILSVNNAIYRNIIIEDSDFGYRLFDYNKYNDLLFEKHVFDKYVFFLNPDIENHYNKINIDSKNYIHTMNCKINLSHGDKTTFYEKNFNIYYSIIYLYLNNRINELNEHYYLAYSYLHINKEYFLKIKTVIKFITSITVIKFMLYYHVTKNHRMTIDNKLVNEISKRFDMDKNFNSKFYKNSNMVKIEFIESIIEMYKNIKNFEYDSIYNLLLFKEEDLINHIILNNIVLKLSPLEFIKLYNYFFNIDKSNNSPIDKLFYKKLYL